jgi:APA family basic amino acid/polyamine antiporter
MPINIGAMVGLASVVFVGLYGQSRIFYSMARDGFLPPAFAAVHKRFSTPHRGTIITAFRGPARRGVSARYPGRLVSIGTLLAFVAVCGGIMILRRTAPKARRPFRTPFVWFVAPAGIAPAALMMFSLSTAPGCGW